MCLVSATNNSGITELHDHFDRHRQFLVDAGLLGELRTRHQTAWVLRLLKEEFGTFGLELAGGRTAIERRLREHRCNQFEEYARMRESILFPFTVGRPAERFDHERSIKMTKQLYALGENPPLGEIPEKMHAWLIRQERFGKPTEAFQKEVVNTPSIADDEVLVYVMAAGVNYNNVWAALGIPVNVIAARNKAGEPEDFHIGGSDASGIVYKVGKDVTNVKVGDEVVMHCGHGAAIASWVKGGGDPMYSPSFRIWGYETNFGSFAQFTKVQGHQCMPKPKHMTWEESAAYTLVAATAWRMLHGWGANSVKKGDVALIWGGAGGLGSMAIQIAKAVGATPVAVVSGEDKFDYCMKLGAKGCINRNDVRPLGHAAALEGQRRLRQVAEGRAGLRFEDLGGARREAGAEHRVRAPGRDDDPDVDLRLRDRRHGGHLRRHHGLQCDRRSALPVDAAEASAGLAFRQRRAVQRHERAGAAPACSIRACRARSPTRSCRLPIS